MNRIELLKDFIATSGLLDGFTDFKGNAQPAPVLQMGWLDSEYLAQDQQVRHFVIVDPSTNGASIPLYSDEREMTIIIFGKGGDQSALDNRVIADYAEQVNDFLRLNTPDNESCMYKATPRGSRLAGKNADGRFIYEIRVSAWFRG